MRQKETHRHREQTGVAKVGGRGGEGWTASLELEDANYYIQDG